MGDFDYFVGIEVEADYCVVAFGMLRFFFDGEAVAIFVEFGNSVAFRVVYPVAEYSCFFLLFGCLDGFLEDFGEACAVEDVVAKDKAGGVVTDKALADDEGLGEAVA